MDIPEVNKSPMSRIIIYMKLARFDHWFKNIFMLPGIVFAYIEFGLGSFSILRLTLTLICTGFIASANYIINELLDAEFDKFHPIKKNRPVVTDSLSSKVVLIQYAIFIIIGLSIAWSLGKSIFCLEIFFLFCGLVYNVKPLRFKDIIFLDVLWESVNNMIRLLLGWFVLHSTKLPILSLLFAYWMMGAFLMAIKRFSEYRSIDDPKLAGLYRNSFRRYNEANLLSSAFFYALLFSFFFGVFLVKYRIEYIMMLPLIGFTFTWYFYISFRNNSTAQEPHKLYKEKALMLIIAANLLAFFVLSFTDIPQLEILTQSAYIYKK